MGLADHFLSSISIRKLTVNRGTIVIPRVKATEVRGEGSDVGGRACSSDVLQAHASILETLVGSFKQHAMCGIHGLGLLGRNGKEGCIKGLEVLVQKVCMPGSSMSTRIVTPNSASRWTHRGWMLPSLSGLGW